MMYDGAVDTEASVAADPALAAKAAEEVTTETALVPSKATEDVSPRPRAKPRECTVRCACKNDHVFEKLPAKAKAVEQEDVKKAALVASALAAASMGRMEDWGKYTSETADAETMRDVADVYAKVPRGEKCNVEGCELWAIFGFPGDGRKWCSAHALALGPRPLHDNPWCVRTAITTTLDKADHWEVMEGYLKSGNCDPVREGILVDIGKRIEANFADFIGTLREYQFLCRDYCLNIVSGLPRRDKRIVSLPPDTFEVSLQWTALDDGRVVENVEGGLLDKWIRGTGISMHPTEEHSHWKIMQKYFKYELHNVQREENLDSCGAQVKSRLAGVIGDVREYTRLMREFAQSMYVAPLPREHFRIDARVTMRSDSIGHDPANTDNGGVVNKWLPRSTGIVITPCPADGASDPTSVRPPVYAEGSQPVGPAGPGKEPAYDYAEGSQLAVGPGASGTTYDFSGPGPSGKTSLGPGGSGYPAYEAPERTVRPHMATLGDDAHLLQKRALPFSFDDTYMDYMCLDADRIIPCRMPSSEVQFNANRIMDRQAEQASNTADTEAIAALYLGDAGPLEPCEGCGYYRMTRHNKNDECLTLKKERKVQEALVILKEAAECPGCNKPWVDVSHFIYKGTPNLVWGTTRCYKTLLKSRDACVVEYLATMRNGGIYRCPGCDTENPGPDHFSADSIECSRSLANLITSLHSKGRPFKKRCHAI